MQGAGECREACEHDSSTTRSTHGAARRPDRRHASRSTAASRSRGRIELKGAKNLVTKAMVAALLGDTPSVLARRPEHQRRPRRARPARGPRRDRHRACDGGRARASTRRTSRRAHMADIDAHAGSSRIPILFCGPLLHRLGEAFIPDLGGCRIGDRPIDFHLEVLRNFGAVVEKLPSGIRMSAPERPARREGRRCRTRASARPSRCCSPRCSPKGITELAERGDRARDHGPHRDPAEDGRDHHGRHRPRRSASRASSSSTATRHRALFDRNEAASWAAAALATERRHLRRRRAPAGDARPSSTSSARSAARSRSRTTASASATRAASSSPSSSRPTCTPAS